jgi:hypothetical protein
VRSRNISQTCRSPSFCRSISWIGEQLRYTNIPRIVRISKNQKSSVGTANGLSETSKIGTLQFYLAPKPALEEFEANLRLNYLKPKTNHQKQAYCHEFGDLLRF